MTASRDSPQPLQELDLIMMALIFHQKEPEIKLGVLLPGGLGVIKSG
jgi:hypothetical protein